MIDAGLSTLLVVSMVTAWRPVAGLLLVISALPWFLHHPASSRSLLLAGVIGIFQLTYLVSARTGRKAGATQGAHSHTRSPLMVVLGVWVLSALVSLVALPWPETWTQVSFWIKAAEPHELWPEIRSWLKASDVTPQFSVVAAGLTLQAAGLAWVIRREVECSVQVGVWVAAAHSVGLAVVMALAGVEAAGMSDLAMLRGDELTHILPGSIQSVAGNRGWFAQYVVYALPYVCVMSVLAKRRFVGVVAACVLVTGAVICLLLAFQRGGWVVGFLQVALLLVVIGTGAPDTVLRGRAVLVRSGMAVIVVAVLAATGFAAVRLLLPPLPVRSGSAHLLTDKFDVVSYVNRLQAVQIFGGREGYWPVSWAFVKKRPLIGGGVESFAYRYHWEVANPSGPLHDSMQPVVEPAAAHNLYLQTVTGTGLLGLASLLAMLVISAVTVLRQVTSAAGTADTRLVALMAGLSVFGIAIYGLAQEVTYIHALRVMLCAAVGLLAGVDSSVRARSAVLKRG